MDKNNIKNKILYAVLILLIVGIIVLGCLMVIHKNNQKENSNEKSKKMTQDLENTEMLQKPEIKMREGIPEDFTVNLK